MSATREGLVQAILEQPDDDEVRLIFADYLEDHDEAAYARFVRTQIALAQVPTYDPLYLRTQFLDRDCVTGHGMEAYRPNLPSLVAWSYPSFERGFPARMEMRDDSAEAFTNFVGLAPELFRRAPIQTMEFRSRYQALSPSLTALTDSPQLARLRTLRFKLGRLPPEEITRLTESPHATNLTGLEFEFAGIQSSAVMALLRSPLMAQLTSLKLHSNNLAWRAVEEAIHAAQVPVRLRHLHLGETTRVAVGSTEVFDAPLMDSVTELCVVNHELGERGYAALSDSRLAGHLSSLELPQTFPGVPGVLALAASPALAGLKRLNLASNRLGPVAVRHLSNSPHLAGLHSLILSHNPIKDTGLAHLLEAPFFPGIVQLELRDCGITEAGLRRLLEIPRPPRLVRLDVTSHVTTRNQIDSQVRQQVRDRYGPATQV